MKIFFIMALATVTVYADPPGVIYSPELRQQLDANLKARGPGYRPRTEFLYEDGRPKYTNRLILQGSPYLLQHAHNPVDWFPWGPEAFAVAKRENKPVFLSIGYSTCHWCHVMERESFESIEVAEYLNTNFVSIKVDRERRPDIDTIYMTAVQMIAGRGGWPMSSFLTTDGKTFHGGTYYPRVQFLGLLKQVIKVWNEDRAGIVAQADKIADGVNRYLDQAQAAGTLGGKAPEIAVKQLIQRHDAVHGGFSPAPKFPNEANYLFLIDHAMGAGDRPLIDLIRFDLRTMARGGIYDQVGGGFHRYSTDDDWLVPHFEKMLYNQAQLARVYLDAATLTGDQEFFRVARQILDYLLRDMKSPHGGFYSATDADSEGGEGVFFLWTPAQVQSVLSKKDAELALALFDITEAGNFEGSNILRVSAAAEVTAGEAGLSTESFLHRVDQIRQSMYTAREQREHPGRDEKIVTAWNAMTIMALAQAGRLKGGEQYAKAALEAGRFLWQNHRDSDGNLFRASLDGRSSVPAVQEDYAWLADAYVSLYDLSDDLRWLDRAHTLVDNMQRLFWDETNGGYFMNVSSTTDADATPVMGRPKDINDGAVPSGNAVALNALARLARRPGSKDKFFETDARATALLAAFAQAVNRSPSAFTYLLRASQVWKRGESGPLQYAAHGNVKTIAHITSGALVVEIKIQPGWHINAHQPLSDNLIATTLETDAGISASSLVDVSYPRPVRKTLGFQSEVLALYEGTVRLEAQVKNSRNKALNSPLLKLKLRLQACDDKICLPPENVFLQVPVH